jgi:aminoglycoside/choline kinase family phosphotransferase
MPNFSQDERKIELAGWVSQQLSELQSSRGFISSSEVSAESLEVVSGDASFRRYFRLKLEAGCAKVISDLSPMQKNISSLIAVDSPPEYEDNESFVRIDALLTKAGVRVPVVFSKSFDKCFLLLEDFGDSILLPLLARAKHNGEKEYADDMYADAIRSILSLQEGVASSQLSTFGRNQLLDEMELFSQWFCEGLLDLSLSEQERKMVNKGFSFIADAVDMQPKITVHRDFHSRNLLRLESAEKEAVSNLGVIDFQDAVSGPYTYDVVSLLRDCYIRWPKDDQARWSLSYFEGAQVGKAGKVLANQLNGKTQLEFLSDFDLCGLQRHLKVMGIFSRLFLRDQKSNYMENLPLTIRYFLEVSKNYAPLNNFSSWFYEKVLPLAETRLKFLASEFIDGD